MRDSKTVELKPAVCECLCGKYGYVSVTATTSHMTCDRAGNCIETIAECKLEPFFFVERLDNQYNHQLRSSRFSVDIYKICVLSTEDWLNVIQIRPVHSFTIPIIINIIF